MIIQVFGWTPDQFEKMALEKINARLGYDRKDLLKTFKVGSIGVTTPQEAKMHQTEIERCYEVNGFLALNDEKVGRGFRFLIEKGLSWEEAQDLADQLALQTNKCAERMIADRKANRTHEMHGQRITGPRATA